jgi:ferredoxin-like protein FixX
MYSVAGELPPGQYESIVTIQTDSLRNRPDHATIFTKSHQSFNSKNNLLICPAGCFKGFVKKVRGSGYARGAYD